MSKSEIKPLSADGIAIIRELERMATGKGGWTNFQRMYLTPAKIDPTIMSKLRAITPETPGGKYTGTTAAYEVKLRGVLERLRTELNTAVSTRDVQIVPSWRFKQLVSGCDRNASTTDKRRGVLFIAGAGSGKTFACQFISDHYRAALNDEGRKHYDSVVSLTCSTAWKSEKSMFSEIATALNCAGGPWRDLYGVQCAVRDELNRRGRVLLVIDEFQPVNISPMRALIWLENSTHARWFAAGDRVLWERLIGSSKMWPNTAQFMGRHSIVHRVREIVPGDVMPFLKLALEKGAEFEDPMDDIAARVAMHATEFQALNLAADRLPKIMARDYKNRWDIRAVDYAVATIKADMGFDAKEVAA